MRTAARVQLFVRRWGKPIQLLSTLAQTVTIILGVAFAVNEFVLKNRAAENDKIKLSLELVAKSGSESVQKSRRDTKALNERVLGFPDGEAENKEVRNIAWDHYGPATADLRAYYRTVNSCVVSGACSKPVLLLILCNDAEENEMLLAEIQSRVANRQISTADRADLLKFKKWCAEDGKGPA